MDERTGRNATSSRVRIRGTREGVQIALPDGLDTADLLQQVGAALDTHGNAFRDAQVTLEYGTRRPSQDEAQQLHALLVARGVTLRDITVGTPEGRAALRRWGATPVRMATPDAQPARPARQRRSDERSALYVKQTLRSGAAVHSDGDLVILGDVNPGSDVSAAGDVIVWGALRGTVHAGANGDDSAIICALRLQPTQLRIGALVARPPDSREAMGDGPAGAFVDNGVIVVEPWRGRERQGR
jgi:septum site-determining protein MinC